jgi:anti-sigma factor (TIGR02949 family)
MSHPVNRTTCEEAFRRLDDFLDRRLCHAEMHLIEEHLEICAACAREFTFEASVLTGVRQKLRQLSLPPDLMDRIAAGIQAAKVPGTSH